MNLIEGLSITCNTTCGCGNDLIPYTKQTETTHYLLTCKSYSERYNHPLLIAIDKNSPVFEDAKKYQKLKDLTGSQILDKWITYQQIVKRLEEWDNELKIILSFSKECLDGVSRAVTEDVHDKVQKILEGKK